MKAIVVAIVLFLVLIFATMKVKAEFIGIANIGQCKAAESVHLLRPFHGHMPWLHHTYIDNALTHPQEGRGAAIYIYGKFFARFTPFTQKFIFQHECGHANGEETELGADRYAILAMQPTPAQAQEVCQSLGINDPDVTEFEQTRCQRIKVAANYLSRIAPH